MYVFFARLLLSLLCSLFQMPWHLFIASPVAAPQPPATCLHCPPDVPASLAPLQQPPSWPTLVAPLVHIPLRCTLAPASL